MLANKWRCKLQIILKTLQETKDVNKTYSKLLELGITKNNSFGVFTYQLRSNLLKFFNLDIYNDSDFNKIISGRIDWELFNQIMSKKENNIKKSKAQLDKEWEDNVDKILKEYDEEFLRNALKELMRRERNENNSKPTQESNKKKTCLAKYLIDIGFSNINAIELSDISERTYYYRIKNNNVRKPRSDAKVYDSELANKIEEVFVDNKKVYGAVKIQIELVKTTNFKVSVSTVYRIKQNKNLNSNYSRKSKYHFKEAKDTSYFVENYLNANLIAMCLPGQIGCADFSVLKIRGEYYHLFVVIDPITTKVLYWEFSKYQSHLSVLRALEHLPNIKYFHSDHGLQFRHKDVVEKLHQRNIIQSMGRKGVSTDNRPAEIFFNWIKNEYLRPNKFWRFSATEVLMMIEDYIDFYNNKRISTIFRECPAIYEQQLLNSCRI